MKHPAFLLLPVALAAVALAGCSQPAVEEPAQGPAVTVPGASGPPASPSDQAPPNAAPNPQAPAPPATDAERQWPPQPPANVIGEAKAESIALAHAKVAKADVKWSHCALDFEDDWGRWDYECEFVHGDTEYSYELDALTGEIVSYERESVWD